jgi:hypothetical protein
MDAEDIEYVVVRVPEWRGSVRLASVSANDVLDYMTGKITASKKLTFLVKSIVDENGNRIPPDQIKKRVAALRRKDWRVVQRLVEVALRVSSISLELPEVKAKLKSNTLRRMAHQIAAERGIINVDAMLRNLSWPAFLELLAFHDLQPSGTLRTDIQFGLLSSIVAASFQGKGNDGKPYSAAHFLRTMEGFYEREKPIESVTPPKQQSPTYVAAMLNVWMDAANIVHKQKGKVNE